MVARQLPIVLSAAEGTPGRSCRGPLVQAGGMGTGIDKVRSGIETLDEKLAGLDLTVETADGELVNTEHAIEGAHKVLAKADDTLEIVEHGMRAGRSALPKAALGIALVGVGIAVAFAIRRSRAGRAAAQADVLEQPEPTLEDVAEAAEAVPTNEMLDDNESGDGHRG